MVLTIFFSKCHEYPLTSMPASLTSNVTRHQNNIQHPDFRPNPNIDVTTRNSKRRALVFFCSSKRPLAKDSGALSRGEVSWGLPGAVFCYWWRSTASTGFFIVSKLIYNLYKPAPSKGCQMVPKGCQFTIP